MDPQASSTRGAQAEDDACRVPCWAPHGLVDGRRHHRTARSPVVPFDDGDPPSLPSTRWTLERLHWHGKCDSVQVTSPVVLWTPLAVATWSVTETGRADLYRELLLAASDGQLVNLQEIMVEPVTAEACDLGCVSWSMTEVVP